MEKKEKPTAHRPIWSGMISIGLVNVPVKLYTMIRDSAFSFRLLHKVDGQPLQYRRVCTRDDRVVDWKDTAKGYEVRKNEFIAIDKEEIDAMLPESDKKIRIDKFISLPSIDPVYFEKPYILVPDGNKEAYGLLLKAFELLGKAGVGKVTLRTKEYPVLVHAYKGALLLTTLRYAYEVVNPSDLEELLELKQPGKEELDLAVKIIEGLSGEFNITEFKDSFREKMEELIKRKMQGEIIIAEKPKKEEAKELMVALAETIKQLSKK